MPTFIINIEDVYREWFW